MLPEERVLFVCAGGHFRDGEGRGGRLLVTDLRIAFRPHRYNVQLDPWSVPFADVTSVRPRLPTFVLVELAQRTSERLVVARRETIAEYLDVLRTTSVEERPTRSQDYCREHALVTLEDATA